MSCEGSSVDLGHEVRHGCMHRRKWHAVNSIFRNRDGLLFITVDSEALCYMEGLGQSKCALIREASTQAKII